MDYYLVSGSATGIFPNANANADSFSVEVDLTKEEMDVSKKEYEVQKALGSLPQKTVSVASGVFDGLSSVSGSISQSCQMYRAFTGI